MSSRQGDKETLKSYDVCFNDELRGITDLDQDETNVLMTFMNGLKRDGFFGFFNMSSRVGNGPCHAWPNPCPIHVKTLRPRYDLEYCRLISICTNLLDIEPAHVPYRADPFVSLFVFELCLALFCQSWAYYFVSIVCLLVHTLHFLQSLL